MPVTEKIRQATTARIEERRHDEQFRARLRRSIEDNQKILDRLAQLEEAVAVAVERPAVVSIAAGEQVAGRDPDLRGRGHPGDRQSYRLGW